MSITRQPSIITAHVSGTRTIVFRLMRRADSADSAVMDSVFSTIGVLAQGLSRFAYTALIGRILGASILADVNVAFAAAILLSLLWPTASGNAVAAFGRAEEWRIARSILRSFAVSLPVLALISSIAMWVLGVDGAMIAQVAMLTLAWSGYIFGRGVFIGGGRVRAAAIWDVLTGVASVALLSVLIGLGWVEWILAPAIMGYSVYALAAGLSRGWRGGDTTDSSAPGLLREFLVWNSLTLIATNGLMQVSMIVAAAMDDSVTAGEYAAALSLATPVSMVAQAVTQAMLPRFGQWRSLPTYERDRHVRRTSFVLTAVMVVGTAIVVVLLPVALPLVYGSAFSAAVPHAQGLMVAVLGFSLSVYFAAYLAATGRARLSTLLAGSGSMIGLLIMIAVGAVVGGAIGAVIGSGAGMLVSCVLLAVAALRKPSNGAHEVRAGSHG